MPWIWPQREKPIGPAPVSADRLEGLEFHQLTEIPPGRGPVYRGESNRFTQGHPPFKPFGFCIEQPVEQLLLPRVKAAVAVAPPKKRLGLHCCHHRLVGVGRCSHRGGRPGLRGAVRDPAIRPVRDSTDALLVCLY
ncbi:hypothetical protein [Synechococcus sp. CBW1108]|uniref:hypothetical protein n=1 Tax=Synechococcus sp. CBW1108 TaxID=1353147 RepID=UPI0018CD30D4|nr:hypothetical protein [Synechococcus sp. CBW1108]QPN71446.1 hypothetical protein H8F27_07805 [Synechococcus sp. CBW1108]